MKPIIFALLLALVGVVHADLGDTYEASCARYGGPGIHKDASVVWGWKGVLIYERFANDNKCGAIAYARLDNQDFPEDQLWFLLYSNGRPWAEFHDKPSERSFRSPDQTITAHLFRDDKAHQRLLIETTAWNWRNGQVSPTAPNPDVIALGTYLGFFGIFLLFYIPSFKWFKTAWKRWIFWAVLVVVPMIGGENPEQAGRIGAGVTLMLIVAQVVRWSSIGLSRAARGKTS